MGLKVCVVTGTRAEYGLLYWLLKGLQEDPFFDLQICVTGMHLSPEFGLTYKVIENDGFAIAKRIEMLVSSDTPTGIAKSIALGVSGFADAFREIQPDIVVLLGDRFEILAAATAALVARIPIAHCHGGESSEGVIDDAMRHAITKMSHLHFTSTEEYKRRVIQLGEQPDRVFNVGALGIENINRLNLLDRVSLEQELGFKLGKQNILVTFHPVTLENATAGNQFLELLAAIDNLDGVNIVFTLPNADTDGRAIGERIRSYVADHPETCRWYTSLGQLRYLSLVQYVDVVVGNSSSGLIEVPSFRKPTINIGDRQKGRILPDSVICCEPEQNSISSAFKKAFSPEFVSNLPSVVNPFGSGNSSELIIPVLKRIDPQQLLKKEFYRIG